MLRWWQVWMRARINTPRWPWEACGTSGMKVLVNGGLNLSELDGWWVRHTPLRWAGRWRTAANMPSRTGRPERLKPCMDTGK